MKDTRTKLIQTAARLFAKHGFFGTSVRQISTAAKTNVAAVNYHFGDKRGLYLATIAHLVEQTKKMLTSGPNGVQVPQDIDRLNRVEALELFHKILDKMMDMSFSGKNVLLERIFGHAEMENSPQMVKILLGYVANYDGPFFRHLRHLTGLEAGSSELILLANAVFRQVHISDFNRFAILRSLKLKDYTPEVKQQIKDIVWHNTYAILKSYEKGTKKR
ncbi:TetR/AcrR family transcriptional regulator [Candidatus Avelusimicrobium sp.]